MLKINIIPQPGTKNNIPTNRHLPPHKFNRQQLLTKQSLLNSNTTTREYNNTDGTVSNKRKAQSFLESLLEDIQHNSNNDNELQISDTDIDINTNATNIATNSNNQAASTATARQLPLTSSASYSTTVNQTTAHLQLPATATTTTTSTGRTASNNDDTIKFSHIVEELGANGKSFTDYVNQFIPKNNRKRARTNTGSNNINTRPILKNTNQVREAQKLMVTCLKNKYPKGRLTGEWLHKLQVECKKYNVNHEDGRGKEYILIDLAAAIVKRICDIQC